MENLEDLSKEQLILLLKQFDEKTEDDKKPYHPDSLMALSLASPKEARAISVRMTPWWTWVILGIGFSVVIFGLLTLLFIATMPA